MEILEAVLQLSLRPLFNKGCNGASKLLKQSSTYNESNVIHCDVNPCNVLLDDNLEVKLADFQGMYKSSNGDVLLDGLSRESTKSYLPRMDGDYADVNTDLFAVASSIYFVMVGHEVFPELDSDDDEDEIAQRFRDGRFPVNAEPCVMITRKCWTQQYKSAREVVEDIVVVQKQLEERGERKD